MSIADYVIVDLAAENDQLREQLRQYLVYCEMAKQAIEQLHDYHRQIESLRRQLASLIDENRRLRYGKTTGSQSVPGAAA